MHLIQLMRSRMFNKKILIFLMAYVVVFAVLGNLELN